MYFPKHSLKLFYPLCSIRNSSSVLPQSLLCSWQKKRESQTHTEREGGGQKTETDRQGDRQKQTETGRHRQRQMERPRCTWLDTIAVHLIKHPAEGGQEKEPCFETEVTLHSSFPLPLPPLQTTISPSLKTVFHTSTCKTASPWKTISQVITLHCEKIFAVATTNNGFQELSKYLLGIYFLDRHTVTGKDFRC